MANIQSTAIKLVDQFAAFDTIIEERFNELDLSMIMMYVVDTAPEAALYSLAEQFNVLGWKGWTLATTEAARRELIKKAIAIQLYKGTPGAIKDAIKAVGFDNAEIREGIGIYYDGTYDHDGAIDFSAGANWPNFRVVVFLPDGIEVTEAVAAAVTNLILEYKNARSILVDVSFYLTLSDTVTVGDEDLVFGDEIVDSVTGGIFYDGSHDHDGSQTYGHIEDSIELSIYDDTGALISSDEF